MAAPAEIPGDHHWRVRVGNEEKVLTLDQLDDLFRLEIIDGDTKVWQPGMTEWLPLSVVAGMDEGPAEAAAPAAVVSVPTMPVAEASPPVVPSPVLPVTVAARPLLPPFTALSAPVSPALPTPTRAPVRPLPESLKSTLPLSSPRESTSSQKSAPPNRSLDPNERRDANENLGSNMKPGESLRSTMTLGSNEGPLSARANPSPSAPPESFAPVSGSRPPPPSARVPLSPPRPGRSSSAPPPSTPLPSSVPSFAPPPFTPAPALSLLGAELITSNEGDSALPSLSSSVASPVSPHASLPASPTPLPSSPLAAAENLDPLPAPRSRQGSLGRGQRAALAALALLGLSITLHRNDVFAKLARASGGESAYQSFHAALGGPSSHTPQGVRAFTASLPSLAPPASLKPPPLPRQQPRVALDSLVPTEAPPPSTAVKAESKAKSLAKKKAKAAKAKAAAAAAAAAKK